MYQIINELVERYPQLEDCVSDIGRAFDVITEAYKQDAMLYICGNGGSAADAEHMVGELMKSFYFRRPVQEGFIREVNDPYIANNLEGALRAIALTGSGSLATAFANDVAPDLVFAQQVYGYGRPGDVLMGISTSGNSTNILHALKVARTKEMKTIGLSGQSGGDMAALCNVCIRVPEEETYKVQELHLPVYHALCRMLESHFFGMVKR